MILKLKIFFHMLNAEGHINACIGMAQTLTGRGHEVHFLTDTSFHGKFVKYGFNEIVLEQKLEDNDGKEQNDKNPLKVMSKQLDDCGLLSNLTSFQKMVKDLENNFFDEMIKRCETFNGQLTTIIDEQQPDLFIVDNVIFEPIILCGTIPWILLSSMSPVWIYNSDKLPPAFSGFPTDSDKNIWKEYKEFYDNHYTMKVVIKQNEILRKFNCPEIEGFWQIIRSPYLNLYGYPKELDYDDVVPKPENLIRVDAFCRKMSEQFELPMEFRNKIKSNDKLVYVSLGSMGSFNVKLMTKMVDILSKTQHKYIVSKGPLHDEYQLADNMWGEEYLPQTLILPLVDLVITHGGNNTVTESFYFGKPMIVMPLFNDQWDNAQRIHEKGFGIRLHTHEYTEQELIDSIDRLLNNSELNQRLRAISQRIQQSNSKEKAAIEIENIMIENNRQ